MRATPRQPSTRHKGRTLRGPSLIVLSLALLLALSGCEPGEVELKVGDKAPAFSLKDLDGKTWSLSGLNGSVVLVNFWATWCPPCKEELPSLQRLHDLTRGQKDFAIVTVLYNDDPGTAAQYAKAYGLEFPVLVDPQSEAAARYGLTGVPETFVIDKKGVVRKKFIGPVEFDTPSAVKFLTDLASE